MGEYLGVDWASKGWVVAELDDDDELNVGFYPTIWNLWHDYEDDVPEQILVDIPIGLPEKSRRDCDEQAKSELGERRSCVFWTPVREAVDEDNIENAKKVQVEDEGADYSISNQTWAIVPRIREVDTFLREIEDAQKVVRESHPEVCFQALNDGESVVAKSGDSGLEKRRNLLDEETTVSEDDCDRAVAVLAEPDYAPRAADDDVLDAIVLAMTAKRVAEGNYSHLPSDTETDEEHPSTDEKGLPMEIVYPET